MQNLTKLLLVLIVAAAFTVPAAVLAQQSHDENDERTAGWHNGRAWEMMNSQEKIYFLTAIENGIILLQTELLRVTSDRDAIDSINQTTDAFTISGFRFSDFTQEVDEIYKERTNIRIPIAYAYVVVIKKANGMEPSDLNDYISRLRAFWNKQD